MRNWEDEYHDPISDREDREALFEKKAQDQEILDDIEICHHRIWMQTISDRELLQECIDSIYRSAIDSPSGDREQDLKRRSALEESECRNKVEIYTIAERFVQTVLLKKE